MIADVDKDGKAELVVVMTDRVGEGVSERDREEKGELQ